MGSAYLFAGEVPETWEPAADLPKLYKKKKYPIEISIPKKSPPPSTKKMSLISRQIKKVFREKSEIFRRIYSLPFSHLMDHEVCSEVGGSSARGDGEHATPERILKVGFLQWLEMQFCIRA